MNLSLPGRVPYVYAEDLPGNREVARDHGPPGGMGERGLWFRERQQGVAVTSRGKAAKADVAYIDAGETLRQAGHLMRDLGVGALDVRGDNGEVQGTISRDMVVKRIAAGGDPKTVTVGEVARRRKPAARDNAGHDEITTWGSAGLVA